jgi:geranylgeranyl pyrophosphate synthase
MQQPARKLGPLQPAGPVQAEIPPTRAQRRELARIVESYVAARKPTPPLSASELRMHADSVLSGAGADEKYRKFVTVLINNQAWHDRVAGIPFNRRLLLLPKCFRAEGQCPGTFDELGLNCKACGLCPLGQIKAEAERLGYVVLVAEGAAAVTAMIQSAKLEAIIGVSCLSVLERVFPHMEASAIPGLAIPLLRDGCRDTTADFDLMWDAIHLTGEDATRRLDLDGLRRQVDAWFSPESITELLGPATSQTERIGQAWLAKSGKRWRPFLAACAFAALGPDPAPRLPADLARVGMAVECFHKASLIHDDIEDGDAIRYGEQTLHEEHGVPVALNVGDFLLAEGYRMIAALDIPADRRMAMMSAAVTGHRLLCLGQGEELSWMRSPRPLAPAEVLTIFRHKTAPAFEVALRLGALFAAAGESVRDVLGPYSEFLGIAYQIRDDVEDFSPAAAPAAAPAVDPAEQKPELSPSDGRAMRPSLLLSIAYELARGPDRQLLDHAWRQPGRWNELWPRIEQLLATLNVRDTAAQLLESYKAEAIRALDPLDNASLKGLLRRVIGRIFDEVELKGWCRDVEAEHAERRSTGAEPAA